MILLSVKYEDILPIWYTY